MLPKLSESYFSQVKWSWNLHWKLAEPSKEEVCDSSSEGSANLLCKVHDHLTW